MKRNITPFVIMLSVVLLVMSCLSDDNDTEITYYDDTAITSFSLGTLNRYLVTKATSSFDDDGNPEDSTYSVEVTGSDYKFYIDQAARRIYNTDSLPQGTDAAHVICNVSSKNSGIIVIKDVDSDTLRYYSSSDSIDFTQEREFRVYATSGSGYRTYKVAVNVHKEDPDSFRWNAVSTCPDFTRMQGLKAVAFNGKVLVYGSDGSSTSVYYTDASNGASWTAGTTDMALDADAWKSVVAQGNLLYTISSGELLVSTDGLSWMSSTMLNGPADMPMPVRLAGGGSLKLYGISAEGKILSASPNIGIWSEETYSGDESQLPTEYISMAVRPLITNSTSERLILAGIRDLDVYPSDSAAMVWNKVEEYAGGSDSHSWIPCNEENKYRLPRLSNLNITAYGDVLIAMGGQGLGTSAAEAFSQIYVSEDNGLTWQSDSLYVLPEEFTNNGSNVFATAVDEEKCLWIICGGNGIVWRGRLNKLGWVEDKKSFTE